MFDLINRRLVLITPIVATQCVAALVERGHRLIGGASLHLHEIGFAVRTIWTDGIG